MTCSIPNPENLHDFAIEANYNGHGTSLYDVLVTFAPFVGLALLCLAGLAGLAFVHFLDN